MLLLPLKISEIKKVKQKQVMVGLVNVNEVKENCKHVRAVLQLGKINNIQKHISVITGLVVRVIVCFQFSSSFRPKSGNFFP